MGEADRTSGVPSSVVVGDNIDLGEVASDYRT